MTSLAFAVIGCGTVAGYGHLPAIAGLPEARLVAMAELDPATRAAVATRYPQANACADYREVLARADIDAVTIATHTETHVEIAEAALRAGKHVLLEKPVATTVADARRLLDVARGTDRIVATGFILRYVAGFIQAKAWCDAGAIGRLRAIRMIDDWWGADHRGAFPGRGRRILATDGSVIVAEGVHYADLARWFSGSEFAALHCVGTGLQHGDIPDHQAVIARMANGVVLNMEISHGYGFSSKDGVMDRQLDLIGEGGVIKWYETSGRLLLYGTHETQEVHAPEAKQFEAMYRDFIASIHAGAPTPSLPTLADGVRALEAVVAAAEADRSTSPL
jgi:predicted dehydrogenase